MRTFTSPRLRLTFFDYPHALSAQWIVKGAPKKKATTAPKPPAGVLRTGESANRGPATPKKFPSTSPASTPNRSKCTSPKLEIP